MPFPSWRLSKRRLGCNGCFAHCLTYLEKPSHEQPHYVRTVQKRALVGNIEFLVGVAQRQRRYSCFALDALVVVKMDIAVNHFICFGEGSRLVAVDALCFENGEEIFCHCIVIRVSPS